MEFYYQIKGKLSEPESGLYGGIQNWEFPPILNGKVEAANKKEAKEIIEEMYGRSFPLRVLSKDLVDNHFLLSIEEIKEGSRISKLFEKQICIHCSDTFYVIDKYNNHNESDKGIDFCSNKCKQEHYDIQRYVSNQNQELNGCSNPVIYKISNRVTNKCYIGKTNQVFTLRWYQHFFQTGNSKFHEEIKKSKVSDWLFEIQEIIIIPEGVKTVLEIENLILERERFWIGHYNSIEEGYNSRN